LLYIESATSSKRLQTGLCQSPRGTPSLFLPSAPLSHSQHSTQLATWQSSLHRKLTCKLRACHCWTSEKQIPPHLSSNFSMSTPLHLLIHLHTVLLVLRPTNGFVSAPHSRLGGVLGGRACGPLRYVGEIRSVFHVLQLPTVFTQRNLCCISKYMRKYQQKMGPP
jgi:hypothetical protein